MVPSSSQEAPALPMPRVTISLASTALACSGPNTCRAGHFSRLPRTIGCSFFPAAVSTRENTSSQLVGAFAPIASSFSCE